MSKSNFLEIEVLKWCVGKANVLDDGSPTPWLALYTVLAGESGGGTEVSGGSYARVNVSGKFADPTAEGVMNNNASIAFPTPTANWGQIVGVGLHTAQSGGNLLRYVPLSTAKTVSTGDPASFPANSITFREE